MSGETPGIHSIDETRRPKIPALYLILGLLMPTATTWVYFVWLADSPPSLQQTAFGLGKGLQILLLAFVLYGWLSREIKQSILGCGVPSAGSPGWRWGIGSGVLISSGILAFYLWVLLPLGIMENVREVARMKLAAYGGESAMGLALIGLFYALFHSGFEELYWRGFVYGGLSRSLSNHVALGLSSLGFMSHHVLVLGKFFGYGSVWTYICSAGVAFGGLIWGVMYRHWNRLWPVWVSHGLVDAALFLVGYHLVFVVAR